MSARSAAGFSLLELLVVLAILSGVSIMAVQTLSVTVTQRRVLEDIHEDSRTLAWSLTLLRRDLQAALPIPFEPAYGPQEPAFHVTKTGEGFNISIGGNPEVPGDGGVSFARVLWKFDRSRSALTREVVSFSSPTGAGASGQENMVMLGITSFSIEAIEAKIPAGDGSEKLPLGFILRFDSTRYGPLTVRVVL